MSVSAALFVPRAKLPVILCAHRRKLVLPPTRVEGAWTLKVGLALTRRRRFALGRDGWEVRQGILDDREEPMHVPEMRVRPV